LAEYIYNTTITKEIIMINVAIVGATGYTGEEIIKILVKHKDVKIASLSAIIDKPTKIQDVFPHLKGKIDIICKELNVDEVVSSSDCVFLALPHRVSMKFAHQFLKAGKKVIDLSADYRLPQDVYKKWYGTEQIDLENLKKAVYGLPELHKTKIKKANLLANPGCYPTSVILGSAPVVKEKLTDGEIIADSKSGVTGAGRKPDIALSFGEVNENLKGYKLNNHQHKPEMTEELSKVAGSKIKVVFSPHLVPMSRGILSTLYFKLKKETSAKDITAVYEKFYKGCPFVRIKKEGLPQIKDVAGTNYCDIGVSVTGKTLIVIACIDNLLKGAAGQAVQNMNIMYGFNETEGLV